MCSRAAVESGVEQIVIAGCAALTLPGDFATAQEIGKSKMAKDPEAIELITSNFFGKQIWRGRLRASFAAFVMPAHNEVIFSRPRDVVFSQEGKSRFGKSVSGTLRVADRTFKATLSPDALKRYQEWTSATTV